MQILADPSHMKFFSLPSTSLQKLQFLAADEPAQHAKITATKLWQELGVFMVVLETHEQISDVTPLHPLLHRYTTCPEMSEHLGDGWYMAMPITSDDIRIGIVLPQRFRLRKAENARYKFEPRPISHVKLVPERPPSD